MLLLCVITGLSMIQTILLQASNLDAEHNLTLPQTDALQTDTCTEFRNSNDSRAIINSTPTKILSDLAGASGFEPQDGNLTFRLYNQVLPVWAWRSLLLSLFLSCFCLSRSKRASYFDSISGARFEIIDSDSFLFFSTTIASGQLPSTKDLVKALALYRQSHLLPNLAFDLNTHKGVKFPLQQLATDKLEKSLFLFSRQKSSRTRSVPSANDFAK